MSLFYNFSDIRLLSYFDWVDFSNFTDFEALMVTIVFNILFYIFLSLFCAIAYKTILRIVNYIF